ncbi:unnamed protein product [Chrysoparadoxa australica]
MPRDEITPINQANTKLKIAGLTLSEQQQQIVLADPACIEQLLGQPDSYSAMCLDHRQRKILVGLRSGHIRTLNYVNGTCMKEFKYAEVKGAAHLGEVTHLFYAAEHKAVISAGMDGCVCVHNEKMQAHGELLRRITGATRSEITAMAYSSNLELIATGNTDGSIVFWDYERCRHEGTCQYFHPAPVSSLLFLDPFPALLAADAEGNMGIWGTRPSLTRLQLLFSFKCYRENPVTFYGRPADGATVLVAEGVTAMVLHVKMAEVQEKQEDENAPAPQPADRPVGDCGSAADDAGGGDQRNKAGWSEDHHCFQDYLDATYQRFATHPASSSDSGAVEARSKLEVVKYVVYAADERGGVTMWDLAGVLAELVKVHGSKPSGIWALRAKFPCPHDSRIERYDASESLKERAPSQLDREWRQQEGEVVAVRVNDWDAHSDMIQCMSKVEDPPALVTSGLDLLVKVWSLKGQLLGVLRQSSFAKLNKWLLEVDSHSLEERRARIADEVITTLQGDHLDRLSNRARKRSSQKQADKSPQGQAQGNGGADDDDMESETEADLQESLQLLMPGGSPTATVKPHVPRLRTTRLSGDHSGQVGGVRKTPRLVAVTPATAGRRREVSPKIKFVSLTAR